MEEFRARDLARDAANAQFNLAGIYLEQKRAREVLELIEQMQIVFAEHKLYPRLAQVQDLRLQAQAL